MNFYLFAIIFCRYLNVHHMKNKHFSYNYIKYKKSIIKHTMFCINYQKQNDKSNSCTRTSRLIILSSLRLSLHTAVYE